MYLKEDELLGSTFQVFFGANMIECSGKVEAEQLVSNKLRSYYAKTGKVAPEGWISVTRIVTTVYLVTDS